MSSSSFERWPLTEAAVKVPERRAENHFIKPSPSPKERMRERRKDRFTVSYAFLKSRKAMTHRGARRGEGGEGFEGEWEGRLEV